VSEGVLSRAVAAVREGASDLREKLFRPEPPTLAVEVRPHSVSAVRTESGGRAVVAAASLELHPGTLRISMTESNVIDAPAFGRALGSVLERAGALSGGPVALVLPDPVARISLLPRAEVTVKSRSELAEMLRFRLKKAVPFEVQDAQVGAVFPHDEEAPVVVAAMARPVLGPYEHALTALGYEPGQVEIGCLALADRAAVPDGDSILVNWDHGYVSLVILRDGWPILVRTLVGDFTQSPEPVVREANNTVLYYRERLGGTGLHAAVLRCASLRPEEASAALREPLGVRPALLDPWAGTAPVDNAMAGQALAGAAAVLLRGAAA
jgi:Tfp pilus assembly PilM family ATPase